MVCVCVSRCVCVVFSISSNFRHAVVAWPWPCGRSTGTRTSTSCKSRSVTRGSHGSTSGTCHLKNFKTHSATYESVPSNSKKPTEGRPLLVGLDFASVHLVALPMPICSFSLWCCVVALFASASLLANSISICACHPCLAPRVPPGAPKAQAGQPPDTPSPAGLGSKGWTGAQS